MCDSSVNPWRAFLICTKQFSRTISVDWIFSAQITDVGFLTGKIRGSATAFGLNKVFGPKTEVTREREREREREPIIEVRKYVGLKRNL